MFVKSEPVFGFIYVAIKCTCSFNKSFSPNPITNGAQETTCSTAESNWKVSRAEPWTSLTFILERGSKGSGPHH